MRDKPRRSALPRTRSAGDDRSGRPDRLVDADRERAPENWVGPATAEECPDTLMLLKAVERPWR